MPSKKTTRRSSNESKGAGPSRRAFLKKGAAVVGTGLVTTIVARDARANGSWDPGGGGGGHGGGGFGGGGGKKKKGH